MIAIIIDNTHGTIIPPTHTFYHHTTHVFSSLYSSYYFLSLTYYLSLHLIFFFFICILPSISRTRELRFRWRRWRTRRQLCAGHVIHKGRERGRDRGGDRTWLQNNTVECFWLYLTWLDLNLFYFILFYLFCWDSDSAVYTWFDCYCYMISFKDCRHIHSSWYFFLFHYFTCIYYWYLYFTEILFILFLGRKESYSTEERRRGRPEGLKG